MSPCSYPGTRYSPGSGSLALSDYTAVSDSSESDDQPSAFTPRQQRNNRRHAKRFAELRDLLEHRLHLIRDAETLLQGSPLQVNLSDADKMALVKAIRLHVRTIPRHEYMLPLWSRYALVAIEAAAVILTVTLFGLEALLGLLAFGAAIVSSFWLLDTIDTGLRRLYERGIPETTQDSILIVASYTLSTVALLLVHALIPLNELIDASTWSQFSYGQVIAIGAAVAPLLAMVIPVMYLSVVLIVDRFNIKRRLRKAGRAAAVYELLRASQVADCFDDIRSSTPSQRVNRHLRRAAYNIRHDMPYRVEFPSARQTAEYRVRCDEMARYIESYAYELFTATDATVSRVRSRMICDAVSLARSRDGAIQGIPAQPLTTRRLVHRLALALRAIFIGAVPAITLLLLHRLQVPVPESIAGVAVIVAIVWPLVTLLMLIDPELPDRVKSTSGLLSVLRGNPPGGDKP